MTTSYPKKLTRLAKLAAEYATEVAAESEFKTAPTLENALDFLYNHQGLTGERLSDDELDIVLERYICHLNGDSVPPMF